MKVIYCTAAAVACLGLVSSVQAAQLTVSSYSTPNGDGQAAGGTYNYWDGTYSGSGAKTTDGAPLSGGTGALTDGFISASPWYLVSNVAGTGQYVGWLDTVSTDPVVTFNFGGPVTVSDIKVYLDNTGSGGVFAPSAIRVDGLNVPFTAPAIGTVGLVDLSGLNLTGNQHTVQFKQATGVWVFVSEVQFFGTAAAGVPEPATWLSAIVGLGLIGASLRRRQSQAGTRAEFA